MSKMYKDRYVLAEEYRVCAKKDAREAREMIRYYLLRDPPFSSSKASCAQKAVSLSP